MGQIAVYAHAVYANVVYANCKKTLLLIALSHNSYVCLNVVAWSARKQRGNFLYKFIKVERVGAVEVITLNRPEVMNAWHMPMRNEVLKALNAAKKSPGVGAIVLTGTGKDAFCAGQDLDEARKFDPARAKLWVEEGRILYEGVRRLDIPVVCALNGLAAGSAFQVALLTDYRIGHDKITMGQPEINSGIVSALGFWILREIVGLSHAIEFILTGRMLSAMKCCRPPLRWRKNSRLSRQSRCA